LESKGIAKVISAADLRPGDAMVCNHKKFAVRGLAPGQQGGGHCLLFAGWSNANRSEYIGLELCGDAHCRGATRRRIPFPYFYKQSCFEPMRATYLFALGGCAASPLPWN
jgi:hypothetical protein